MSNSRIDRRNFIAGAIGGTAGLTILRSSRTAFSYEANERLNLAVIGVGGYASVAAFMPAVHIYENLNIVALCDVDQRKVAPQLAIWNERAGQWPNSTKEDERQAAARYQRLVASPPPLFQDFRRMFDKMGREIDAVVVATPDHTHAVASATAIRAGKHVLAEKPLTINAHEARALRDLAATHKVATSVGTQGMQSGGFRRGVELIREGAIGPVERVHIWFSRGGRNHKQPPQGTQPVPPELNWDLWLGPVAWREYHPNWIARCHWRDTGIGELGNFGPHTGNLAFMALNVGELWQAARSGPALSGEPSGTGVSHQPTGEKAPTRIRVEAECSEINRLSFPVWEKIRWRVPSRGDMPPVTFTWHHGPVPDYAPGSRELLAGLMREHGATDEDIKKHLVYAGAMIIGGKGAIVTDSHNVNITLFPKEKFAGVDTKNPKTIPASRGHYRDWLHACRGGQPQPLARFEYAATFSEFLMLGDVATEFAGNSLEYDPVAGRIINNADANAALRYEYRKGWNL